MSCHNPKVRRKPSGEWICSGCRRVPRLGRPPKLGQWTGGGVVDRGGGVSGRGGKHEAVISGRCGFGAVSALSDLAYINGLGR